MSFQRLTSDIDAHLARGERVVVIIDGMAASGKTTLAASLSERYSCNVIPMDLFFLRPEQRTPERLAAPGGNIDYERFATEVASPLRSGEAFSYRPYDCSVRLLSEPINITPAQLTVVEGVYSLYCMCLRDTNAPGGNACCIKVFMKLSEAMQRERLMNRDPELFERFQREWLPMEHMYFEHFDIQGKCDYVLEG